MSEIPLGDDETDVVFVERALRSVRVDLTRDQREKFLKRLIRATKTDVPTAHFIEKAFQDAEALTQFRAGDEVRGLCILVERYPERNLLIFYEVTDHDYSRLAEVDREARETIELVERLDDADALVDHFGEERIFSREELQALYDQFE